MKITRGIHIKKRVTRFFTRVFGRRRHARLPQRRVSGVFSWVRRKATSFMRRYGSPAGYVRLGRNPTRITVPKGHLAVYVGQKEGDCCRVLVPVIYFNHPLFGRLLSEAEERFGFDNPGQITIPCPVSEFESVTTRIQATARRWGVGRR